MGHRNVMHLAVLALTIASATACSDDSTDSAATSTTQCAEIHQKAIDAEDQVSEANTMPMVGDPNDPATFEPFFEARQVAVTTAKDGLAMVGQTWPDLAVETATAEVSGRYKAECDYAGDEIASLVKIASGDF